MKHLIKPLCLMIAMVFVVAGAEAKNDKDKGGKNKDKSEKVKVEKDKSNKSAKTSDLPPGLEMNQQRGKPLPPGWQKRLQVGQPLEQAVWEAATIKYPVDKHGLLTVSVDGKLIRLVNATREVVEVINE